MTSGFNRKLKFSPHKAGKSCHISAGIAPVGYSGRQVLDGVEGGCSALSEL